MEKMKKLSGAEFARKYGIFLVLVIMSLLLICVSPTFRTVDNAVNILRQVSVNGIIAIGMTFVIMTGGIDLTVGSVIAVSGVIAGSILVKIRGMWRWQSWRRWQSPAYSGQSTDFSWPI